MGWWENIKEATTDVIEDPSLGSTANFLGQTSLTGGIMNAFGMGDVFKKKKQKEQKFSLGPEEERIQQQLKERAQGAGDVAAQMQQGKAATVANLQRQQAAQGLKGGGTAKMLADVERQQQGQIAASLYGMKGKALGDEISYLFGKKALQQKPPKQKSFLQDLIGF